MIPSVIGGCARGSRPGDFPGFGIGRSGAVIERGLTGRFWKESMNRLKKDCFYSFARRVRVFSGRKRGEFYFYIGRVTLDVRE